MEGFIEWKVHRMERPFEKKQKYNVASHFRTLRIEDIRRETADCVSVAFAIPLSYQEEFRYRQGQNITLKLKMEGEEIRRSYSICSSPLENELRIAIKKVPGGLFSTYANEQLQKGQELEVLPPSGKFYTELHPGNRKHYLAFAAGSGITPDQNLPGHRARQSFYAGVRQPPSSFHSFQRRAGSPEESLYGPALPASYPQPGANGYPFVPGAHRCTEMWGALRPADRCTVGG